MNYRSSVLFPFIKQSTVKPLKSRGFCLCATVRPIPDNTQKSTQHAKLLSRRQMTTANNDTSSQTQSLGFKKTFGNPNVLPYLGPSVWTDIVGLTIKYNACNLGQGLPEHPPPEHVKKALLEACENNALHQYTRGYGHFRLVEAIAKLYGRQFNRTIDAPTEVLVTTGAYESLYCIIMSLLGAGDEAIIIEPFFDCYGSMVGMTGAKPVYIPLHPPPTEKHGGNSNANDWTINMEELEGAFNERTKMIIVNSPNNPLGKVFSGAELQSIADLCHKHDVVCLSDEVYEWMVYEPGLEHIRMANLPGMWHRTFTVCSAGKTFNTTGWKLGWTIGTESLMKFARGVHQNTVYTNATMLQEAVAVGLEHEFEVMNSKSSYFTWVKDTLKENRDFLAELLKGVGFEPHIPQGGYFIMAEYSHLPPIKIDEADKDSAKDFQIVRSLIREKNLTAIPVSAFYSKQHEHIGEKFLRFCFFKNKETLEKAAHILKQWKSEL